MQFTAYVRANDGAEHDIVWEVKGSTNTTVQAGTTVNQQGKLTLASNQDGQIHVTATVTHSEDIEVVGESIVTVIPKSIA